MDRPHDFPMTVVHPAAAPVHGDADTQAALPKLLSLVESGLMEAEDPSLKERLTGLKLQRDELAAEIAEFQQRLSTNEPEIIPEKIERFAALLRDRLLNGTPEFRQAYARLII